MFEPCDCGSGATYLACCGKLHAGQPAQGAEQLMRSRYTAFARCNAPYLLRSWAAETRPLSLDLDRDRQWTGLTVLEQAATGPDTAVVRFAATWRQGTETGKVTETSRFRREGAGWVYIDGVPGRD